MIGTCVCVCAVASQPASQPCLVFKVESYQLAARCREMLLLPSTIMTMSSALS
jgi:hypothetical protein